MLIRKWVKKAILLASVGLSLPYAASAEWTAQVSVIPGFYIPLGDTLLQSGPGGAVVLDFMPSAWLGFFAQGEYVSVSLKGVEGVTLTDGSAGGTVQARLTDRFSLRGDVLAGVYSATRQGLDVSGMSAGARLGLTYHATPAIKASVTAAARHYAYTPEPFMNALALGAGLSIDLDEALDPDSRVEAQSSNVKPVFPVFYSWYDENPFATLKVTNRERNDITDVRTYFYLERYMAQPKLCATNRVVAKGETVEIPARAFFNEGMLELTERVAAPAKVIVEYRSLGAKRRVEIPVEIPVYHRNAMNWEDDRRAAAFVSSRDPAAMWFAKYVANMVRNRYRDGVNKNVQYAAGTFETLDQFGLNYVIDPASAYADNTGSSSVDFLQYPYQTLMYRGGDCDDLSILYCSLLEAMGIEAAFVTIPGHIYVAFDSGLTEAEARERDYFTRELIFHGGKAWVPVEITLTKEGFSKAWRVGAKEWRDADARGEAQILPVSEAWKEYPPVSVPGAVSRFSVPDERRAALAFDRSIDAIVEREIRPKVRAYTDALARNDSADVRNRLGVLYGRYGMLEDAKEQFSLAARRGNLHARVNLANVSFLEEDYKRALGQYNDVLARDPDNNLATLGAARCHYELDEYDRSDSLYAELGTRDVALSRSYGYLGSFFDSTGRAWSLSDRLSTTTWSLPEGNDPVLGEKSQTGYARDYRLAEGEQEPSFTKAGTGLLTGLLYAPPAEPLPTLPTLPTEQTEALPPAASPAQSVSSSVKTKKSASDKAELLERMGSDGPGPDPERDSAATMEKSVSVHDEPAMSINEPASAIDEPAMTTDEPELAMGGSADAEVDRELLSSIEVGSPAATATPKVTAAATKVAVATAPIGNTAASEVAAVTAPIYNTAPSEDTAVTASPASLPTVAESLPVSADVSPVVADTLPAPVQAASDALPDLAEASPMADEASPAAPEPSETSAATKENALTTVESNVRADGANRKRVAALIGVIGSICAAAGFAVARLHTSFGKRKGS